MTPEEYEKWVRENIALIPGIYAVAFRSLLAQLDNARAEIKSARQMLYQAHGVKSEENLLTGIAEWFGSEAGAHNPTGRTRQ